MRRMIIVAFVGLFAAQGVKKAEGADWKWSGDYRLRIEHQIRDGADDRARERMRARLNMSAQVNEKTAFKLRLTTGDTSATSQNQSFTGAFANKLPGIDQAFIEYKDGAVTLFGGKMGSPFQDISGAALHWDGGVTPEGFAFAYKPKDTVRVSAGHFMMAEYTNAHRHMHGLQVASDLKMSDNTLTVGASYYSYSGTGTANDLAIVEGFVGYSMKAGERPMQLYAQFLQSDADDDNTAYVAGFSFGRARAPGSWALNVNYREHQANSAVSGLVESGFLGSGTDKQGLSVGFSYALQENMTTGMTFQTGKSSISSDTDMSVVQLDLSVRF